jgi:ATP-binding cassette subfamily B protein
VLLLQQLQQPLTSFTSVLPVFYSRLVSCERLAEIDGFPKEDISYHQTEDLYYTLVSFSVEDLSFSYGRDEIFSNTSVAIPSKEIVCVTGVSGAGKSTLFRLLMNVYAPNNGGIYLQTKDRKTLLTAKERGLFAYVPQGNFLFSGTIRENLTFFYDKGKISEDQIREALETACADFVYELPQGLETELSEHGAGLSEGQLQRLAIARALISNRPILLLDESTSALDAETEKAVLQNLKKLENKSCLIVTHRLAALEIADHVARVENGKIYIQ